MTSINLSNAAALTVVTGAGLYFAAKAANSFREFSQVSKEPSNNQASRETLIKACLYTGASLLTFTAGSYFSQTNGQVNTEIANWESKYNNITLQFNDETAKLNTTIASLMSEVSTSNQIISGIKNDWFNCENFVNSTNTDYQSLRNEFLKLDRSLVSANHATEEKDNLIKTLIEEVNKKSEENTNCKSQIDSERQTQTTSITNLQKQNDQLLESNTKLQEENKDLTAKLNELVIAKNNLEASLKSKNEQPAAETKQ